MRVKNFLLKIIVTLVILGISLLSIYLINPKGNKSGSINLIISDNIDMYNKTLEFKENETLFDLLDRTFEVGKVGSGSQVIILSLKGENFNLESDFNNTFLAFYELKADKEVLLEYGAGAYYLNNNETIMIRKENIWKEN